MQKLTMPKIEDSKQNMGTSTDIDRQVFYCECGNERRGDASWCEECCRRRHQEELYAEADLPKRQQIMLFDNFYPHTPNQKQALSMLHEYDANNPRSIYINGPVGVGKTHLACALCNRLIMRDNKKVLFRPGVTLLYKIRGTFRTDSSWATDDLIYKLSKAPFLILDDLGAEKLTEWVLETFYLIVDNRYNDMLPTIVTSNFSPRELAIRHRPPGFNGNDSHIGDRIVSRLISDALILKLEGPDHRVEKLK